MVLASSVSQLGSMPELDIEADDDISEDGSESAEDSSDEADDSADDSSEDSDEIALEGSTLTLTLTSPLALTLTSWADTIVGAARAATRAMMDRCFIVLLPVEGPTGGRTWVEAVRCLEPES